MAAAAGAQAKRLEGYRRLAAYMAWEPGSAIFSRFTAANMLNLLGFQVEISKLEKDLHAITTMNDEDILKDGVDSEHWKKILELRGVLSKYNDALLQQISLNAQPNPNPRDLKELRYWLRHIREGKSSLRGPGSWIYSENYGNELSDMIPLSTARAQREFFTRLITKLVDRTIFHIPEWLIERSAFRLPEEVDNDPGFWKYSTPEHLRVFGDLFTTVLSCVLTTIPVIVLSYLPTTRIRLGAIVGFTLVFTIALTIMSNAKRGEIFAAAAAFAAIQVVFVGSVSQKF